jgi:hypothetical protein
MICASKCPLLVASMWSISVIEMFQRYQFVKSKSCQNYGEIAVWQATITVVLPEETIC